MAATTTIATTFHGVRYLVTDVKRAAEFYTAHFGFTLEHQMLPHFATVALGPLKILLSGPSAAGSRPSSTSSTRWIRNTRALSA